MKKMNRILGKYDSLQDAWYVESIRRHPELDRIERMSLYDAYLTAYDAYRKSDCEIKSDKALSAVKTSLKGKNNRYNDTVLEVFEELRDNVSNDFTAHMYEHSKEQGNSARHA